MKDAYYFPHDSNARNDQRIVKLRMKHGIMGYGVYFGMIEILRETKNYLLQDSDIQSVAFDLRVDPEIVKDIINSFELFEIDKNKDSYSFYSKSLKRRMEKLDLIKEKRAIAGAKGGKAKAIGKHLLSNKNTVDKNIVNNKKKIIKRKSIEVRKQEFSTSVQIFEKDFGKKLCNDFTAYWSEKNPSGKKMRFEMQKTFEIKRRLTTWKNNNFNNGNKNGFISDNEYDHQKREERRLQENRELKKKYAHIFNQ